LEIEGCVYVLACNYQLIVQGQKFGVNEAELKGRIFFDKIIQVAFNMPMSQYKAEKFCQKMLKALDIVHDADDIVLYIKLISLSVGFTPPQGQKVVQSFAVIETAFAQKRCLKSRRSSSSQ